MRLIDADAYAAEMKKRQDACKERIDNPTGNVFTDREHWEGVFMAYVEAKLVMDEMPTICWQGKLAFDCRGFTHCFLIKGARMSPNDEDGGCAPEDEGHGAT